MREYKHPDIDHTFLIKDINMFEIEIDGIRVHRRDVEWMERTANYGLITGAGKHVSINELSLPFLQHILALKHKKGTI
jgi:hypothetical protein